MYRICLIRHGKTQGNLLGRYIGVTDECLCQEGREQIQGGVYPLAKLVFASPLRRCMETAGLIYPGIAVQTEELLRECDFGAFENKNYEELSADSRYQAWVDSGGSLPFPQGESHESFCARCREGFRRGVHMGVVREERGGHFGEERGGRPKGPRRIVLPKAALYHYFYNTSCEAFCTVPAGHLISHIPFSNP